MELFYLYYNNRGKNKLKYTHIIYIYTYYIYMKLNLFALQMKLTQHCKSTIIEII